MTRFSTAILVIMGALVCAAAVSPSRAEEPRRRWYVGGNLSYFEPTQSIRSNAGIVETSAFGDDGIPSTGDPNERQACSSDPAFNQVVFCDPRPDDQIAREYGLESRYRLDVTAGVALSRYFSLQADASRVTQTLDPVDLFHHKAYPALDPFGFPKANLVDDSSTTQYAAGELTQTTYSLSGIVRFRPRAALRPYAGAGFGRVLADLEASDDVERLNAKLAANRIRGIGNEFGVDITGPQDNFNNQAEGRVPFVNPLAITVDDGYAWHLAGGLEYRFTDRLSVAFDARYTFVDQEVVLDFNGEDQIDLLYWPEEMFRPDGSLLFYFEGQHALHPWCIDSGFNAYGCFNVDKLTTRVDPTGDRAPAPTDPGGPPRSGVTCPARADFDDDGVIDVCLPAGIESPRGFTEPKGIYVAQGGSIGLDAFTVSVGLRFRF